MKQAVISVVRMGKNGMTVNFNGNGAECLQAIGVVLASAVQNMAQGGTPEADIKKQIEACVEYGMMYGLGKAGGATSGN